MLLLGGLTYICVQFCSTKHVHLVVMAVSILYMSQLHINRMIYDYGGYVLDITGPIMIAVQKTTSLAFSVHDGLGRKDEELSAEQRKAAVRRKPNLLEYAAYFFSFQTLMCGPLVYYVDFIDFVDGQNFKRHLKEGKEAPSPTSAVLTKLFISTFFALSVVVVHPLIPADLMVDDKFIANSSWFYLVLYMTIFTTVARFKYYFAWRLGETVCNASGLGFNGLDEGGSADWELVSNISIWRVEVLNLFKHVMFHVLL